MPPLEFWFTVDATYFVGAFLVSLVLGVLGIGRVKKTVIGVLLVVSLGIVSLGLWSTAQRSEEAAKLKGSIAELRDELTGSGKFAFIRVRPEIDARGENYIAISTTGALPSLRVGFYQLTLDGKLLSKKGWEYYRDLPHTTFHPNVTLPPGRYQIDFKMGNETWTQHLEFERSEEGVDQVFWVEKNDIVIHQEP